MASYTTSEIRGGLKVLLDGDPYTVIDNEFVKPGKGQAFNRIRVRNLKTGRTIERTFKSGESLEAADVVDMDMQYLYQDGDFWHFMVPESFVGRMRPGEEDALLRQLLERQRRRDDARPAVAAAVRSWGVALLPSPHRCSARRATLGARGAPCAPHRSRGPRTPRC